MAKYQQVEYIESTGTQYIDTGVSPCMNTIRCFCEMSPMNTNDTAFFGTRGTYYLFYNVGSNYFWPTSKCEIIEGTLKVGEKYTVDWNKGVLEIWGNGVYEKGVRSNSTVDTQKLRIFNFDPLDSSSRSTSAKLYSFLIWQNDVIVRDFIPCYRTSDNVIGLFDNVENKFYTNSGTGTFLKGPDVLTNIAFNKSGVVNAAGLLETGNQVQINPLNFINTYEIKEI